MKDSGSTVPENTICAGGQRTDVCQGDSGGPLTCARNGTSGQEERYLCGIVSWGMPCNKGRGRFPSVFTDVTKYTGWIKKFMRNWWRHYWGNVIKTFHLFIIRFSNVMYYFQYQYWVSSWDQMEGVATVVRESSVVQKITFASLIHSSVTERMIAA